MPFVAYGYMKSPEEKNKLAVDTYAAEVVRKIFYWKIEGMSTHWSFGFSTFFFTL